MRFRDLILTDQSAEASSDVQSGISDDDSDQAHLYAEQLAVQLRKGFLTYCVLKLCSSKPKYANDLLAELKKAEMLVVEGTMYPLLTRMHKDGLLVYEWKESEQGPPRKYYKITKHGSQVLRIVDKKIAELTRTIGKL